MIDRYRFSEAYDPEPDDNRPTRAEAEADARADEDDDPPLGDDDYRPWLDDDDCDLSGKV